MAERIQAGRPAYALQKNSSCAFRSASACHSSRARERRPITLSRLALICRQIWLRSAKTKEAATQSVAARMRRSESKAGRPPQKHSSFTPHEHGSVDPLRSRGSNLDSPDEFGFVLPRPYSLPLEARIANHGSRRRGRRTSKGAVLLARVAMMRSTMWSLSSPLSIRLEIISRAFLQISVERFPSSNSLTTSGSGHFDAVKPPWGEASTLAGR
jgi:hypothetical protein